jgi:hypothetical protein
MSPGPDIRDDVSVEGPLSSSSSAGNGWQLTRGSEDTKNEKDLTGFRLWYSGCLVPTAMCL